jgi:hypothetical protein
MGLLYAQKSKVMIQALIRDEKFLNILAEKTLREEAIRKT